MGKPKTAAIPFILITLVLDILGIGLIIPVLPQLVTGFGGGTISEGSGTFGWFVAVYAAMQFIFSPILGSLSDQYGRRPVILLSLLGAGVDYVVMAVAPDLTWLFVGRLISGVTGANVTAVNAYVADVSPPEKRAQNYGLMGACFGVGFILGPALGGLLGTVGPRVPFMAAAGLNLCNALYGFFVLPESLSVENRRRFSFRAANPVASLGELARYPVVLGLTGTLVCIGLAQQALQTTWVLFTTYRFEWTPLQNGLSLGVLGLCSALVQGGLTRVLIPRLGERRALVVGTLLAAVAFTFYGLATHGWMLYVVLAAHSLGGIAGPSAQALISRQVDATQQGTIQGAVQGLVSLTGVAGPLLFTHLFGYFTSPRAPWQVPGVVFFCGTALLLLAVALALRSFARGGERGPPVAPLPVNGPAHG